MSETRKAKRAARQSRRDAARRDRELHPNRVDAIADLPPLWRLEEFALLIRSKYADPDGADLPDAVDDFVRWVDDQIEIDLPGDGPLARAGEALLEAIDGPVLRALAKALIKGAARVPVVDRRHP